MKKALPQVILKEQETKEVLLDRNQNIKNPRTEYHDIDRYTIHGTSN